MFSTGFKLKILANHWSLINKDDKILTDSHLDIYRCLSHGAFTDNDIIKIINELNSNKNQGHDMLSIQML